MNKTYDWDFPLPRTHTGILQGNGTLGAMIWGDKNVLRITLGRADHWDHRGGMPWTEKMSYANIRACLEKHDEAGLRALFEKTATAKGEPNRPSVIPIGRLDLDLGEGAELEKGTLDMQDGTVLLSVRKDGRRSTLRIDLDMHHPVLSIAIPKALRPVRIERIPAWSTLSKDLAARSFKRPTLFAATELAGWTQACPADPAACVGYRRRKGTLVVAVTRGEDAAAARGEAVRLVEQTETTGRKALRASNLEWWTAYWASVPSLKIPNKTLAFLYTYGMYKFASLTNPAGVAASLQGTWIEEYQMPPWSSDYHFNINVQMCYQPAYHGNRLENLVPLFELVFSWEDTLRHNARVFLGIDDGVMLPHAVDDHCTCMGGFWTGSIDHGCTAWVALMMYRYYRYTMDADFLRRAYPFMVAAMRVYEEMLETRGNRMELPVSVSPEYRGAGMDAWGRNASFQLACIHALCESLTGAADALGETPRPAWGRIMKKLPKACLIGDKGQERIALWEGVPLEESHRHHSHLAGITPFDVFDMDDPKSKELVTRSLADWLFHGPALWSGWCIPWASTIHSHMGNAEAAELYLEVFDRIYTNEGHGTRHDAYAPGFTLMGIEATSRRTYRPEVMQMDGGMGSVAAIQEMLLHTRRGVTHLFAGAPARWKQVAFKGMRTEGAFLVDAARAKGEVTQVKVESLAGGTLRLANPWDGPVSVRSGKRSPKQQLDGAVLEIDTAPGDKLTLTPAE